MSDLHRNPGRDPLHLALTARGRLALCIALLPLLLGACVAVKVRPVHTLPPPLVQPMPVQAGLVVDEELRSYVHEESRSGTDWHVELGAGHEKFFQNIFGHTFEGMQSFPTLEAARAAGNLQVIFRPRIDQYSFATASETSGGYWAVTIRYRIAVYSPAGELIDTLVLTGYGSWQGRARSAAALTETTRVAIRDAAAKFLVQMPEQPLAVRLREGQPLSSSDAAAAKADVIEAVPIDPLPPG